MKRSVLGTMKRSWLINVAPRPSTVAPCRALRPDHIDFKSTRRTVDHRRETISARRHAALKSGGNPKPTLVFHILVLIDRDRLTGAFHSNALVLFNRFRAATPRSAGNIPETNSLVYPQAQTHQSHHVPTPVPSCRILLSNRTSGTDTVPARLTPVVTQAAAEATDKRKPKTATGVGRNNPHLARHQTPSTVREPTSDRPIFELDVIGQPPQNIVYGTSVETSVLLSLRLPSPELAARYANADTSRLLAIVSLVEESRSGERKPMESGTLTSQQMSDSVHPIPEEYAETLARSQPDRAHLGYFTFPALLIRQPGLFRLRVTLIQVCPSASGGGSTVAAVDSESIKVERRHTGSSSQRRQQRM
ncbi:unnamed protein product [Zymoseptoria tritici ST99CH_3D7]|uniref:Velvet domain-containing protein n=1 Tax=Zymoseptoria tritici (strain ST99CH_3D7) TaxID=1276538 RepID=A0A1X7RPT3_ZYMT9|nr:unnamed protein product [Zymoseptoria tritici ST99CH_3D7]